MPAKRLLGPAQRQRPQLDGDLTAHASGDLEDGARLEDVSWTGAEPTAARDIEILRARLTNVALTGLGLDGWRLVDVELVECELSGTVLSAARWERVVLRRCRMAGLVASELKASDVRIDGCKADGAWLRGSVLDRCEVVDTDLSGADLFGAQVTRSAFRRCDLSDVDVSASRFEQVSLHGSTVDRLKGADALRGCTIGSDQLVALAIPVLAAHGITLEDEPPDLVEP